MILLSAVAIITTSSFVSANEVELDPKPEGHITLTTTVTEEKEINEDQPQAFCVTEKGEDDEVKSFFASAETVNDQNDQEKETTV